MTRPLVVASAVHISAYGGSEVLRYAERPLSVDSRPTGSTVLVRNAFAGVNFIDTYYRTGLYKNPTKPLPFIAGIEGSGTVLAVGPDADPALVGQRVAFFEASLEGSYATLTMAKSEDLYRIPPSCELKLAAAAIVQGCTADMLVRDVYRVAAGNVVLIHACAGGTGLLIAQMARAAGATVIGLCGGPEKAELARTVGKAHHVIDYTAKETADWEVAVRKLAPEGVHVVYDGVGRATFDKSISCLRRRGAMVSFGNASGAVEPVAPLTLAKAGSLSLHRPMMFDYMDRPSGEAQARVDRVMRGIVAGELAVHIGQTFMLRDAVKAHELLESKQSVGKILLDCSE